MKRLLFLNLIGFAFLLSIFNCQKKDEAPAPVATFTMDKSSAEVDETITFTNTSQNATDYLWEFGDGATSSTKSPTHSYNSDGTFTVQLTATGEGGTNSSSKSISITYPPAVASFDMSDSVALEGVAISFSNTSANAASYSWDFGDGTSSTETNPSHSYSNIGIYTIELTVNGNGGDIQSTTSTVVIYNIVPGERIGEFILGDNMKTHVDKIEDQWANHFAIQMSNGEWLHLVTYDDTGIGFFITSNSSGLYETDIPDAIMASDPFECVTEKNISIGSTLAETQEAYGDPDNDSSSGNLSYTSTLGISFWADDNETLVEDIYITEPSASGRMSTDKIDVDEIISILKTSKSELINIRDFIK